MNIKVLFTGGTIGSCIHGNYIGTDTRASHMLLSTFEKMEKKSGYSDSLPVFHTEQPYSLLSENLTGKDLNKLITCVSQSLNGPYDGVIVAHGTDTLQYTASALAIFFRNCSIPIVLVSSNYILEDPRANGLINFSEAVHFIRNASTNKQGGVFVSYCNQGEQPLIHPAHALLAHHAYDDKLLSLPPHLSQVDEINRMLCKDELPSASNIRQPVFQDPCPVLYIKAMPGQSYPALQPHIRAVLLETYHSGTLCTAGSALSEFTRNTDKINIPVYVTGIENRTAYESTKQFHSMNITVLPSCSPIYAYMLLWFMTSK